MIFNYCFYHVYTNKNLHLEFFRLVVIDIFFIIDKFLGMSFCKLCSSWYLVTIIVVYFFAVLVSLSCLYTRV